MKTYQARVAREGTWWMVRVPEIDGLTQARRYSEVEEMARSLLAIALDVPEDSFDLRVEVGGGRGRSVTERPDALHQAEEKAGILNQRRAKARRSVKSPSRSAVRNAER